MINVYIIITIYTTIETSGGIIENIKQNNKKELAPSSRGVYENISIAFKAFVA